jgi:hypothetical protein
MVITQLQRIFISCSALSLLFIFSGCGPKYRAKRLEHLNKKTADYHETKNNVTVYAKKFSPDDLEYYFTNERYLFGGGVVNRMQRHLEAIEVTVDNGTANTLILDPKAISLDTMNLKSVYKKVSFSCIPPMLYTAAIGAGWATLFSAIIFHKVLAVFVVPVAIADGLIGALYVHGPNKHLKKDLTQKMLQDKQVIYPDELKSFLLFVNKKEFVPSFILNIKKDSDVFADFDVVLPTDTK